MTEEPDHHTCRWCKVWRHPVASLVADHELTCEWREGEQ